jgi:hypothetical protein
MRWRADSRTEQPAKTTLFAGANRLMSEKALAHFGPQATFSNQQWDHAHGE